MRSAGCRGRIGRMGKRRGDERVVGCRGTMQYVALVSLIRPIQLSPAPRKTERLQKGNGSCKLSQRNASGLCTEALRIAKNWQKKMVRSLFYLHWQKIRESEVCFSLSWRYIHFETPFGQVFFFEKSSKYKGNVSCERKILPLLNFWWL